MKVIIVGGVAAGMSAATRLRRLDEKAEIVVFERGPHVSFANCGLPYHIGGAIPQRESLVLQTPAALKAALNLDVRVQHEVVAIERAQKAVRVRDRSTGREFEERYDRLVLCPGAAPIRPPLPGAQHPAVLTLRNLGDMDAIKARVDAGAQRAVVIGAGYIGVEMAENLRARGLAVALVEMQPQVLPPLDREMTTAIADHLVRQGVSLHLSAKAAAILEAPKGLRVRLQDGAELPADLVILSVGVKPDVALAREAGLAIGPHGGMVVNDYLQTSDPNIYAAGDAIETPLRMMPGACPVPLAGPANRQGRVVADHIAGRPARWIGAVGTSIVKVFDMTAGATGANEKSLKQAGIPYRKVYLHPAPHAGYYPGARPMHIKLLFVPDQGRLLGAQVVGFDGVDKRLDVLATALSAEMTVHDLQDLELAYAPPYGSAKDPVNMAGFVASNLLKGDNPAWYAEEYPHQTADGVVVDVRGPPDYAAGHIAGAVNIPLPELRRRAGDLPTERTIYLYCQVGYRSYLAARALAARGYAVKALSGGFNTFRAWHQGRHEHRAEPDRREAAAPDRSDILGAHI